jgi:mono/diheme cytochrome c family protein
VKTPSSISRGAILTLAITLTGILLTGCEKEDMAEEPRKGPHQPSAFFADGDSARPLVEGTVNRDGTQSDAYEYQRSRFSTTAPEAAAFTTLVAADFPDDFPRSGEPLRRALDRGRERFNIYCAVCHGETGAGDGMIVQRGFVRPPAFYPIARDRMGDPHLYQREQNLLVVAPGYIVDKITNGYGAMYSYAARVQPADRWAIAAYVRALQLSRSALIVDLPRDDIEKLSTTKPSAQ